MTIRKRRVLVVEADSAVRAGVLGALEAADFEGVGAADTLQALEALSDLRIDVMVADYQLPGILGLDLLAAIRGTAPGMARQSDSHPSIRQEVLAFQRGKGGRGTCLALPGFRHPGSGHAFGERRQEIR